MAMSTHASGVGFYIFVVIHYRHSGRHMMKFWPTWSAILLPVVTLPKESVISDRSSCKTYKPDWLRNDAWHAGPFLEKIIMLFSSLSSHFYWAKCWGTLFVEIGIMHLSMLAQLDWIMLSQSDWLRTRFVAHQFSWDYIQLMDNEMMLKNSKSGSSSHLGCCVWGFG